MCFNTIIYNAMISNIVIIKMGFSTIITNEPYKTVFDHGHFSFENDLNIDIQGFL